MKPRSTTLVWGAGLLGCTLLASVLPLWLPFPWAPVTGLLAALAAWAWLARVTRPQPPAPEVRTEPAAAPPAPVPREDRPPTPETPDLSVPRIRALEDLSWKLHEAIIQRVRSLLTPLSTNLFGIRDNLRGMLQKSSELESSFHNDSRGLKQTVQNFEAQSVTIRVFATEMDRSVQQFETSGQDMAQRLGKITEAIQQINDVAERIKVLSINASIEAARAGHQGAGFKVISQEVRRLAEDTNQFSSQAEKTISEAIAEVQGQFGKFIVQYQGRAREIHQIQATTQELEAFLKNLFDMIGGIFQEYNGFVTRLDADFDGVSPALQQTEIGTQQIENTWKGIREAVEALGRSSAELPRDEAARLVQTFSRHLTTPLEAEVVDQWARKAGVAVTAPRKEDDDITLF